MPYGGKNNDMVMSGRCIQRALAYFSVLRPSVVFGLIVFCLPFTAYEFSVFPDFLNGTFGNMFVEYRLWDGFWFGLALFGAVWAVMLTTCLILDTERDGQYGLVYDPSKDGKKRRVTVPMDHVGVFIWFTLLSLPGIGVVILKADTRPGAAIGLIIGGCLAYLLMDLGAYLIRCGQQDFRVFPWKPFFGAPTISRLASISRLFSKILSSITWKIISHTHIGRKYLFDEEKKAIKSDHLFAAWSLMEVAVIYWIVYRILRPDSFTQLFDIEDVPPAAFIYALLLPLIWLISGLWAHISRYRIVLLSAILVGMVLYGIGGTRVVESTIGGPAHTYDVFETGKKDQLLPNDILASLKSSGLSNNKKPHLIIVAASGGGILAAGWTSKVLCELHRAYPDFGHELRVVSAVSGGSAGAAHYISRLPTEKDAASFCDGAEGVIANAMETGLAITAYGVAFPDFRRALFPIWTDEDFDRGRLLERHWRKRSNIRLKKEPNNLALLSDFRDEIRTGGKPVVIFNATVLETGENIAITPLSTLKGNWFGGATHADSHSLERHYYAKTLSEFLVGEDRTSIDLWTAVRLSATFSYVSPAARASFATLNPQDNTVKRRIPNDDKERTGLYHLIDGGYHDNYGVATAINWLVAALEKEDMSHLPFDRIALIEIRAQPHAHQKALGSWTAAWLGPLLGLLNSWDLSQSTSNDTAVNRMMNYFKEKGNGVPFESFVFVPAEKGPLSWHLSRKQKEFVENSWKTGENAERLKDFLNYMSPSKPINASHQEEAY
jgi:hypothetical protein